MSQASMPQRLTTEPPILGADTSPLLIVGAAAILCKSEFEFLNQGLRYLKIWRR